MSTTILLKGFSEKNRFLKIQRFRMSGDESSIFGYTSDIKLYPFTSNDKSP